jgi:gas vesicle protein
MNHKTELLATFAFAAGVAAGILMAPDRGDVTRRKIAGKASNLFKKTQTRVGETADSLKQKSGAIKNSTDTGRETYRQEMEKVRS